MFKNNIFVRILLIISGIQWSPQWRTTRNQKGTYEVVYKARDKITDLFVALKKIQKREITIFCVKLGHMNNLSTRVGSGIADWLRKGLENNHQDEISSQISPMGHGKINPKKAIVKFTAEEKLKNSAISVQCSEYVCKQL